MSNVLFAIRHAHRDTEPNRKQDNGLSVKGRMQARRLSQFLIQYQLDHAPDRLISSPSIRCVETLFPLSERYERPVERLAVLSEQAEGESDKVFEKRIENFVETWRASPPGITVLCSHGDWLPRLTDTLVGVKIDLRKGAFTEFEYDQGKTKLRSVLQDVDFMPDV